MHEITLVSLAWDLTLFRLSFKVCHVYKSLLRHLNAGGPFKLVPLADWRLAQLCLQ